jgi:hypothetical protein
MSIFNFWKSKPPVKKFKEALDTPVFTTKFVINYRKDITYVTHEAEDGAWQFLSDDKFEDVTEVIMTVSLGQMIDRDETVLELADMPEGHFAVRDDKDSAWVIEKI